MVILLLKARKRWQVGSVGKGMSEVIGREPELAVLARPC